MSDVIYYKNGEETFRISPPTVETKCPETKLEVKKMNEIEKTEGEIKVLQAKLELLKKENNHKSSAEKAYKKVYGEYPPTTPSVSNYEDDRWSAFVKGYIARWKVEEEPKPEGSLKFQLGKSLEDILYDWWSDVFVNHSDLDTETSISDLVDRIELFLPKPQSAEGSQSVGAELLVEGWNNCISIIKGKLR